MSKKISIDAAELQRLRLEPLFLRHAIKRGWYPEVARELAGRAASSPEFALDCEGNLNADDWTAGAFLDGLVDDPKHAHLFQQAKPAVTTTPDEQRKAEAERVAKLPPLARLEYANRQEAAKRRAKGAA